MKKPALISLFLSIFLFSSFPSFALSPGDLIINEIMADPTKVTDQNGEWFEIYNPTNNDIFLNNLTFKDADTNTFTIPDNPPLIIPSHAFFVLGKNESFDQNGGLNLDYQYSNFQLANTEDEIIIIENQTEIDKVFYNQTDFPLDPGYSFALINLSLDNNQPENWQKSNTPYGNGDYGTPGSENFPSPTPTSAPTLTPTPTSPPAPSPTLTPSPSPPKPPSFPKIKKIICKVRTILTRILNRPFFY